MYPLESSPRANALINGREVDYFCGTGYFSMQGHPQLIQAACDASHRYGISSATSQAGLAINPILSEVETKAAAFFDTQAALYYASGYFGAGILLQGLSSDYDIIFVDAQSHYAVMDGATLAGKPMVSFAHCDVDDLARQLESRLKSGQRPLIFSDGIFPMSGVIPPLPAYDQLLGSYPGGLLCVDDAHAYGVIGNQGRGTLEYAGIEGVGRYSCGTLSKAFGGYGGIITGSQALIDRLKQRVKVLGGSSPVPVAAAAASAKALEILSAQPTLRQQLWANVAYAKNAFRELGFDDIPDTPVPIICLGDQRLDWQKLQQQLFHKGLATLYMAEDGYSSVPVGGALRIAIFSSHSHDQIDRLVREVGAAL